MVTVGRSNRFKRSAVMSGSPIDRFLRARNAVNPRRSLFGRASEAEVRQFLRKQNIEELAKSYEKLDKYDIEGASKVELLYETESDEETKDADDCTPSCSSANNELRKFRPTIITEENPAPARNLFSPIDKVKLVAGSNAANEAKYWQTSKRRRSSEEEQTQSETSAQTAVEDSSEYMDNDTDKT